MTISFPGHPTYDLFGPTREVGDQHTIACTRIVRLSEKGDPGHPVAEWTVGLGDRVATEGGANRQYLTSNELRVAALLVKEDGSGRHLCVVLSRLHGDKPRCYDPVHISVVVSRLEAPVLTGPEAELFAKLTADWEQRYVAKHMSGHVKPEISKRYELHESVAPKRYEQEDAEREAHKKLRQRHMSPKQQQTVTHAGAKRRDGEHEHECSSSKKAKQEGADQAAAVAAASSSAPPLQPDRHQPATAAGSLTIAQQGVQRVKSSVGSDPFSGLLSLMSADATEQLGDTVAESAYGPLQQFLQQQQTWLLQQQVHQLQHERDEAEEHERIERLRAENERLRNEAAARVARDRAALEHQMQLQTQANALMLALAKGIPKQTFGRLL